jgi:hypothetical protein
MNNPYELLGIPETATSTQVKAAYHTKLREFPAHQYPNEFKAIRAAYESIQKGAVSTQEDFFKIDPLNIAISPEVIGEIKENLIQKLELSLEDMLKDTF